MNKIHEKKQKNHEYKLNREEINKRKELYKELVSSGDLCFDVGANIGNRIEPLLKIGAKVVAFEPQESCSLILQQKFGDKIIIITDGLGEEESEKDFFISSSATLSSFSEEWIDSVKKDRFKGYEWNKPIRVKITTLDKIIEKYGLPIFIKIDVEGYELNVLKGLSHPVKFISFEYTVPEQTENAIECIKRLRYINENVEFNYSIGETMEWAMIEWLDAEQMSLLVRSEKFIHNAFGDIYARNLR